MYWVTQSTQLSQVLFRRPGQGDWDRPQPWTVITSIGPELLAAFLRIEILYEIKADIVDIALS